MIDSSAWHQIFIHIWDWGVPIIDFKRLTDRLYWFFVSSRLISEFFAKSTADLGDAEEHATKVTDSRPPVLVLNGTGEELAPCALDDFLISNQSVKTDFLCPYPQKKMFMPRPGKFTSFGSEIMNNAALDSEGVEARVKAYWDENSCALCNHVHCMCSKEGEGLAGSQAAIDSISRLMSTSPYLGALVGKEFSYDNPASKVLRMSVLFGSPLAGYDNTTHDEPEVGGEYTESVPRHFVHGGSFKYSAHEWTR